MDVPRPGRQRQRQPQDARLELDGRCEHMFDSIGHGMRVEYREEPCRSALNRVQGMPFDWSLNPYMGCAHRCTFCYVRAFEARADRPSDDRYGTSIRVKTNVAEVLRRELARPSWEREPVAIGAATDPYQPAEGRYRLTRACIEALGDAANPFSIITRGPLIVRDIDVLAEAARRARRSASRSRSRRSTAEIWRRTEPGTAPPRQRLRALAAARRRGHRRRRRHGADPARAERPARAARRGRARGARGRRDRHLGEPPLPQAGHARALPRRARARLARAAAGVRAAVRAARLPPGRARRSRCASRCARSRAATASATAGAVRLEPPPEPEQLQLAV